MRDKEFAQEFARLASRLEMFFLKRMKKPIPQADKAQLVEDLVQLTAMKALEYSRRERHAHRSIEELLFKKADNIWKDYINPRRRRLIEESLQEGSMVIEPGSDPHQKMVYAETVEILRELSNPNAWLAIKRRHEGYSDVEIALGLGVKQENLRQIISRQIKKIIERWDHLKYL
jgi:DNA-directed RNA polymerase specialized sigma24 family protein